VGRAASAEDGAVTELKEKLKEKLKEVGEGEGAGGGGWAVGRGAGELEGEARRRRDLRTCWALAATARAPSLEERRGRDVELEEELGRCGGNEHK
jgi:hypothetical protein